MFLAYLDSAHFAYLDQHMHKASAEADAFFNRWAELGATLALTGPHLLEMGQQTSEEQVDRRLGVLARFPSVVWLGPVSKLGRIGDWIIAREVELQLTYRLRCHALGMWGIEVGPSFPLLRGEWLPVTVEELRTVALNEFGRVRKFSNDRTRVANYITSSRRDVSDAIASGRVPATPKRWPPRRLLPGEARRIAEFWPGNPYPYRERIRQLEEYDRVVQLSANHDEALARFLGLHGLPHLANAPREDYADLGGLIATAREEGAFKNAARFALQLTGELVTEADLLQLFNPYEAPGVSHYLAAARGARLSGRPVKQGDIVDQDHVLYAPYVDVHFVDGRTHHDLEVARNLRPHLYSPYANPTIHGKASLNEVLVAVAAARTPP